MEKILKTVSKEDRANGKIIIDLDLGWVIEEDDLFAIAHDQSNHDLANLLDKICGRRLFVEYSSFDKLDSNVKEALEKIGSKFFLKSMVIFIFCHIFVISALCQSKVKAWWQPKKA